MNGKRKNRSSLGRSPRGRGIERVPSVDGIYHNASFMHAITSQIGNVVKVYTHTGTVYEGILKTFSSLFEVVLELAHKIDSACPTSVTVNTVIEKIIFKPHDVIFIEVLDSETDYATRDTFQTDTAISKFNGQIPEKELEPWDCPGGNGDECDLESNGTINGWDANDMFKKNEQMYGVKSNYDYAMSGYTTQLQNKNSKDYKDAEAEAAKIANEIENNPTYKARVEVENGDEEEKFAAVVRPCDDPTNTENTNKYVCPPKRKPQPQPSVPPAKPVRNVHVKLPEHKPSTSLASYFHPSVPAPSSNGSHTSMRERINGIPEPPKPQRPIPSHRPVGGRSYPSSDNGRVSGSSYVVNSSSGAVDLKPSSQISNSNSSAQGYVASPPEVPAPSIQRKPSPGIIPSPTEAAPPHIQRRASPVVLSSPTEVTAPHLQRKPSPNILSSSVEVAMPHVPRKPSPAVIPPTNEGVPPHAQRKISPGVMPPPSDIAASHVQRKPSPSVINSPTEVAPPPHIQRKLSSGILSSPSDVPPPHIPRKMSSGVISSPTEVSAPPMPRKTTYNPPLIHPLTGEQLRTKANRGREDHVVNDLKKFSNDFHLADSSTEPSKVQIINTAHDEDNRLSSDPSVNVGPEPLSSSARPLTNAPPAVPETEKTTPTYLKSKLNPNAKEFVYNPNSKPFTPRSSSTPTQSRPHTPQTPSYGVPSVQTVPTIPAGAMVVPTYVVTTAQPHYTQPPPNQHNRYRKVQMGMPPRPDMTSQMQVAAATGQPLLPTGPIPAQFTVPYTPQPHLANQPYQQMVRMVTPQGGGMVPLVPATINYPHDPNQPHAQHIQYMGQGAMAAVPHHPHHNPYIHGNAVSPQPANNAQLGPMNGNGGAGSGANGNNGTNGNGHQQPYPSIHHTPHPHLAPFSFTVV